MNHRTVGIAPVGIGTVGLGTVGIGTCTPIKQCINFKIATLTPIKTLATGQPGYLLNLLNTYLPVHSLRSQDNNLLARPSVYTSIDRRAFSYAAPQIANDIPLDIRISPSVSSFKRNLKTLFCRCIFTLPCATSDCPCCRFCQLTDIVRVTNFYIDID